MPHRMAGILPMREFLEVESGQTIALSPMLGRRGLRHVFDDVDVRAVNAAIAADRPLLLRGEPGVGKSQLARAAAQVLGRAFVSKVIDARTEPRDLLYYYDAVRRLAAAQVAGVAGMDWGASLREENFLSPGALWWAFDWAGAEGLPGGASTPWAPEGWTPVDGVVVLLDEMDKADSSVPNGLLEALGEGRFDGPTGPVMVGVVAPLVVVTTNEERALPNAFLRRCMVHHMQPGEPLKDWLIARGRAHFDALDDAVLETAAQMLSEDRSALLARGLVPPGQAEYLDILRVLDRTVAAGGPDRTERQLDLLEQVAQFAFRKHGAVPGA